MRQINVYYVLYEGKRMYFPKILYQHGSCLGCQGCHEGTGSAFPASYILPMIFSPTQGSIIIDAGVAEGNFALSVVDKAKRLYLVECDRGWMEALRLTFEPWKEKVVFIEKFMSDTAGDTTTSIDELMGDEADGPYFIKLDIEGYEQKALCRNEEAVDQEGR